MQISFCIFLYILRATTWYLVGKLSVCRGTFGDVHNAICWPTSVHGPLCFTLLCIECRVAQLRPFVTSETTTYFSFSWQNLEIFATTIRTITVSFSELWLPYSIVYQNSPQMLSTLGRIDKCRQCRLSQWNFYCSANYYWMGRIHWQFFLRRIPTVAPLFHTYSY